MGQGTRVKICGLRDGPAVRAAAASGAAYVGLVFFAASPRAVSIEEARALAVEAPPGLAKVGLFVDPDDAALDAVLDRVPLDMIQLHGDEAPARVAAVRARHGLPVMKAVGLRDEGDLPLISEHARAADQILVDARPAPAATLPGGNGAAFDWRLVAGLRWSVPWMLAGGLTPGNVAEAIRATGARQVDVSSGVERAPGAKDPGLIAAFCSAAGAAGLERRTA